MFIKIIVLIYLKCNYIIDYATCEITVKMLNLFRCSHNKRPLSASFTG